MKKILLLEKAKFILLRDSNGNEVAFDTVEDFNRCVPSVSFAGMVKVNYEPDKGFHIVDGIKKSVPYDTYDLILNDVNQIAQNKLNEYYGLDVDVAKDLAFKNHNEALAERKKEENLKDFSYNGVSFTSDKESIQATQNDCLSQLGTDPILTFRGTVNAGSWLTTEGFVPFTNEEFITFAKEYFLRGSDNYTTMAGHIIAIKAIMSNASSTAADILAYDFSGGWH